jgi:ABC-type sugar transport system permease subunit
VTVVLELTLGLALALALHARLPGRGLARTAALLPWALPTVVAALVWRFLFDGPSSIANQAWLLAGGAEPVAWLAHPQLAWVPLILADVWKTTPFVMLLLLAGLQSIDESLLEAARVDGASAWQRLWHVTLPLLWPVLSVAVLFRAVDALRVFDLVYVLTGGGPGTATEPVGLYTFSVLLQHLRFGYGSALFLPPPSVWLLSGRCCSRWRWRCWPLFGPRSSSSRAHCSTGRPSCSITTEPSCRSETSSFRCATRW